VAKVAKIGSTILIYYNFESINHLPVHPYFRIKSSVLTVLLMLPGFISLAQDPYFKRFRVEEGLPSNEVYGIAFDRNNILWVTTDRGVWRFDGYQSRQFTVSEGLKENTNLRIFVDRQDRVWLSSINNHLFRIINDSVYLHPFSDQTNRQGSMDRHIQQLHETDDGSLWLSYNRPGLYRFSPDKPPELSTGHLKGHEGASVCIFLDSTGYWWDMIGFPDTSRIMTSVIAEENRIYITSGIRTLNNDFRKYLHRIGPAEFLFSYSNKLFHIRGGKLIAERSFSDDILSVYVDNRGGFWVGLMNDGVAFFKDGNLQPGPRKYLLGESVTGITQDYEGNYWFSSLTNGIYQAVSLDLIVYPVSQIIRSDNIITGMASDGMNLVLGTQTGRLFKGLPEVPDYYSFKEIPLVISSYGPVRKIFFTRDGHLLVLKSELLETDLAGRPAGIRIRKTYPFDYTPVGNDRWTVGLSGSVETYQAGKLTDRWDPEQTAKLFPKDTAFWQASQKVRIVHYDTDNRLWLGAQEQGVFTFDSHGLFRWNSIDTLLGKRTHEIIQAGRNMWISVADYGISVIRPDSTILRITQKDGLSSDIVDCLFAESETVVWAGTNKGVNRITIAPDADSVVEIRPFTIREGLPSNRIYKIIRHQGNLWLATNEGAVCILNGYLRSNPVNPTPVFDTIFVNGVSRDLIRYPVLKPGERNLVWTFRAISYRIPHDINYRYYLEGVDRDPVITQNLETRYPDLRYGTYTFHLNASYTTEFNPDIERSLTFTIRKHWYETWPFRIIMVLIGLALIYLIIRIILNDYKDRIHKKQQLLEAEKKSLLSQMNPHFIFNSLNSIQHFIIQNDDYQANNYLSNFSSLIRRILDNSKKDLISLNEEIATLTLYLGMEKLRFEENFEYRIIRDPGIDYNQAAVPPMMIQPLVENVIWHGIMPLGTKGMLTLTFSRADAFVRCLIRDNGIGREKAATLKSKKEPHLSTGTSNIMDRINLMNRVLKKKIELKITDLKGPDGTPSGTEVELIFPLAWI